MINGFVRWTEKLIAKTKVMSKSQQVKIVFETETWTIQMLLLGPHCERDGIKLVFR